MSVSFWWSPDPALAVVSFSPVRLHSEFPRGWGCSSVAQDMLWVPSATAGNGGRPEGREMEETDEGREMDV